MANGLGFERARAVTPTRGKAALDAALKQAVGTLSVPFTGRVNELVAFLLSSPEPKKEPVMVALLVGAVALCLVRPKPYSSAISYM